MDIYGVDFTSAPGRRKPITTALSKFFSDRLEVIEFKDLFDFESFENMLKLPGPWIAGFDFPFGQSRKLVTNLDWPLTWEGYVGCVAEMSKEQYIETLNAYKKYRKAGDKEHRRTTDVLASSISPQKLYGVPVGKMFFEGAPRLLRSDLNIQPVRPNADNRIAIEAYPALLARRWVGKQGYKSDTRANQTEKLSRARKEIARGIMSPEFKTLYGFALDCSVDKIERIIDDATGDQMDSL
ncbi:MAG: hypothetical protein RQ866_08850, partial [Bacteroidales bacterium]|nr:hypothetical protein [Bacteroidales bacterium]